MGSVAPNNANSVGNTHIGGTLDAVTLFRPALDAPDGERLCVAHLDEELRLLSLTVVDGGPGRKVTVPMRALMRDALNLDTRALVIGHNHPHGDTTPSLADKVVTRRMSEVAKALDIRLLDHLIFAGDEVTSFRELGLL